MYLNLENNEEDNFIIRPRKRKRVSSFGLRLTSMIDMFTILLVFLLKSFSLEGEIISMAKDLQLPESTAKNPPKPSPILIVTNEWVILDGDPVEKVDVIISQPQNSITALKEKLASIRTFSVNLGQLNTRMGFKGTITIQGDKEIPFEVLKKIMFTCGREGYNNMLLAVLQEEQI